MSHNVVCNNCGIKGHVYRDCRNPVLSYGNILYRTDNKEPQILMIQRKDSLCYIEFIRGKYDIKNIEYIQILIDKCSTHEKERLVSLEFETLWKDLWMIDDSLNERFKGDYKKGYDKFTKLQKGIECGQAIVRLQDIVERSTTTYSETEWEFPKGRRNPGETNRECAIREFSEETGYVSQDYEFISNMAPLDEEYMGENRVCYKHIYYIGFLKNHEKQPWIDTENPNQITEVKDIRWLTCKQALEIIRDYHHTREAVILKLFAFVNELNHNYFVVE